jgi:hypothetical protein
MTIGSGLAIIFKASTVNIQFDAASLNFFV